jgi:hypothetical protein
VDKGIVNVFYPMIAGDKMNVKPVIWQKTEAYQFNPQ